MVERMLVWLARGLVRLLQTLSVRAVARLGRGLGFLTYVFDRRHRRVALANLRACFAGTMTEAELRALARENFRRIGENLASGIKTAAMDAEELRRHVEFVVPEWFRGPGAAERRVILAVGHFGNFELYPRMSGESPWLKGCAATYRALRPRELDQLFQAQRERSGCLFFERRSEAAQLQQFLRREGVALGLLCDQNAGSGGVTLPFLGRDAQTSRAPALYALRYDCTLVPCVCYRIGLGRWRVEMGDEIPLRDESRSRSVEAIMRDVNRALEDAVRRDPANWFWPHDRWKLAARATPDSGA